MKFRSAKISIIGIQMRVHVNLDISDQVQKRSPDPRGFGRDQHILPRFLFALKTNWISSRIPRLVDWLSLVQVNLGWARLK